MKECQNCGAPMIKDEDFGNNDPKSCLCCRCYNDNSNTGSAHDNEKSSAPDNNLPGISNFEKSDDLLKD